MSKKVIFKNYKIENNSESECSEEEDLKVPIKVNKQKNIKEDVAKIESEEIAKIREKLVKQEIEENEVKVSNTESIDKNKVTKKPIFERIDLWRYVNKTFDPDIEYKRILGNAFSSLFSRDTRHTDTTRNRRNMAKHYSGKIFNRPIPQTKFEEELNMVFVEDKFNVKLFKFVPNREYLKTQLNFNKAVRRYDIEYIIETIYRFPFHLSSVAVGAHALMMQDRSQDAKQMLERAIWYVEHRSIREFDIFSINHRLPYIYEPNRPVFIILSMYMKYCIDKKCYDTAMQFAKIIFSKDIEDDPLSTIIILDVLALKSNNLSWLFTFFDEFNTTIQLEWLPNYLYSMAIAHNLAYLQNDEELHKRKADEFIERAFVRFPFVVTLFMDKMSLFDVAGIENCSFANLINLEKQPKGYQYLNKVYLHHALSILKKPENMKFIQEKAQHYFPLISADVNGKYNMKEIDKRRNELFVGVPKSLKRHMAIFGLENVSDINLADPFPPKETKDDVISLQKEIPIRDGNNLTVNDENINDEERQMRNEANILTRTLPDGIPELNLRDRFDRILERIERLIRGDGEVYGDDYILNERIRLDPELTQEILDMLGDVGIEIREENQNNDNIGSNDEGEVIVDVEEENNEEEDGNNTNEETNNGNN
uniref:Transcription factor 25 n=1 Tax=Parastrongyloides trichosuri TaxID=131310 RepID=A0A0N5A1N9_PARTI